MLLLVTSYLIYKGVKAGKEMKDVIDREYEEKLRIMKKEHDARIKKMNDDLEKELERINNDDWRSRIDTSDWPEWLKESFEKSR